MRQLPERPSLVRLRAEARALLNHAIEADPAALDRLAAVHVEPKLAGAQLAVAREYGFTSWARLKTQVQLRTAIAKGDVAALQDVLARHPEVLDRGVGSGPGGEHSTLQYVAVAGFHGAADPGTAGRITTVLLDAGLTPETPGETDTALVTAASYGEIEMVLALIARGADLEAAGTGIPGGGTPLAHAVFYGNTEVVDVLLAAGAIVHDAVEAAGAGTTGGWRTAPSDLRAGALRAAAVCGRLDVLDELVAAGLDVNVLIAVPGADGGSALHWAAFHARAASIHRLLALGADPLRPDRSFGGTPLGWCRKRLGELAGVGHPAVPRYRDVEALLAALEADARASAQARSGAGSDAGSGAGPGTDSPSGGGTADH